MEQVTCDQEFALAANGRFEKVLRKFLRAWVKGHRDKTLLRFDKPMKTYLAEDALRDFFLNNEHPLRRLLVDPAISRHLGRSMDKVYFDPVTSDPLLALSEQRIYNLARRMDREKMHVPFRSVHPNKQTETGDTADITTYPVDSEIRYNSGNHFASRPANGNVIDENSRRCSAKSDGNLHVFFKRGFMEERLQEIKAVSAELCETGVIRPQFFVICSRHSQQEGHFGVSLIIMQPANPDFPYRVLICDTLQKELPLHPRWWNHFVEEYRQVFGVAVTELLEDISHPLQKVNIKNDAPYRHDWDCPYYAATLTIALAEMVKSDPDLILHGSFSTIYEEMKVMMPEYYLAGHQLKDRVEIREANLAKRWNSGQILVRELAAETSRQSSYEY